MPAPDSRPVARMYDSHLRLLASHYSNMWSGRSNSASFVANYFHDLVGIIRPELFVEVGAHRAEASRRVRSALPDARVVAFEANPYNFAEFSSEYRFAEESIEYLNSAITEADGPITFHLRVRNSEGDLDRITGNSSLLRRADETTEYEEISVAGVSLDSFFADDSSRSVCLWIDVEGASGPLLRGAKSLLERTRLVIIEVEELEMWQDQWRSIDVIEYFLEAGFVPLTRDAEYNQQYNIIFIRDSDYERPDVLWSHELHMNYIVQHLGIASTPDPDAPIQAPSGELPSRSSWRSRLRR